jgi:hypothetical protein
MTDRMCNEWTRLDRTSFYRLSWSDSVRQRMASKRTETAALQFVTGLPNARSSDYFGLNWSDIGRQGTASNRTGLVALEFAPNTYS